MIFLALIPSVANHKSIENPIYLVFVCKRNGVEIGNDKQQSNRRKGFLESMNFMYAAPVSLFIMVLSKSKSTKFM
ncbi:hypothetical protein KUL113_65560 [Tenacibaculum sp. KUL113]|nr:hypothetical protein KUL113_65560 [Tenacibaculum sp. KUL113]